ncbi:MAG: tyrosine-type recombinase/integrase [bacterium]|nr:tyrosine-type recombinase/integrase [bacterium]
MNKSTTPILGHLRNFFEYLDLEEGLSRKTQETYSRLFKQFLYWLKINHLEGLTPHELTEDHVWQYRVFLSKRVNKQTHQPLEKSTQNYYLIALRALLKYFTDRNITSLPSEKVKLAKLRPDERAIKFLTLEQIKKLLDSIKTSMTAGIRNRAILEILFSTGLRVAELVSLDREQIKIGPETNDLEIVVVGKGNRPRPVYFSKRSIGWLKKYLETRHYDKEKALFINYKGPTNATRRLSARSVENIVKRCAILADIPAFTSPHTLRHSFATDLLMQGVDLRQVQEFLGHKNIGTTQIYAHVTSKKLRDTHRKFHSLNS